MTDMQYSGGQYAQGLVLAELQAIAPVLAELITKQNKLSVEMSNAAFHSVVAAAAYALTSSLFQSGISLATGVAGGASAGRGILSIGKGAAEQADFKEVLKDVNENLELARSETLQMKSPPKSMLNMLRPGEDGLEMQAMDDTVPAADKDPKDLEFERKNLMNKHQRNLDDIAKSHQNYKDAFDAIRAALEAVLRPGDGLAQKGQQEQQGLRDVENQSSQQVETEKQQAISTWTALIQAVAEVQGYTSAMAR